MLKNSNLQYFYTHKNFRYAVYSQASDGYAGKTGQYFDGGHSDYYRQYVHGYDYIMLLTRSRASCNKCNVPES